jgi:asparagine synthase (glutamine-hydrolysing)
VRHGVDLRHLILYSGGAVEPHETAHVGVLKLTSGSRASFLDGRLQVFKYWTPEQVPQIEIGEEEAKEELRGVLNRAVADRLQGARHVGVALSSGLDSTTVAALAAKQLHTQGRRLESLTHVPAFPCDLRGDERSLVADFTAVYSISSFLFDAARISPIDASKQVLEELGTPDFSGTSVFWVREMCRLAGVLGWDLMLTGKRGNYTISWPGPGRQHRVLATLRGLLASRGWPVPRHHAGTRIFKWGAICSLLSSDDRSHLFARAAHRNVLAPGLLPELAAAEGLEVSDPTADLRVVEFCLSLPSRFFDPNPHGKRWLIRQAMEDFLPKQIVLAGPKKRQVGDLVDRVRASHRNVEENLAAAADSPVLREFLDLEFLNNSWLDLKSGRSRRPRGDAMTICEGLKLAHFLDISSP